MILAGALETERLSFACAEGAFLRNAFFGDFAFSADFVDLRTASALTVIFFFVLALLTFETLFLLALTFFTSLGVALCRLTVPFGDEVRAFGLATVRVE